MNIALILAGGIGSRIVSEIPKQYIEVKGKPIISYCLENFDNHVQIDFIHIVAEKNWHSLIKKYAGEKLKGFSEPGETRQLSILNGLKDIMNYASDEDVVIIHDAARPMVSLKLITSCLEACLQYDGVMPALPMKDTVYYGKEGEVVSLLERDKIIAGQAPEAFRFRKYFEANQALYPEKILKINGSMEPAIMAGMHICYIQGEESNFKITTQDDLERFEMILDNKER